MSSSINESAEQRRNEASVELGNIRVISADSTDASDSLSAVNSRKLHKTDSESLPQVRSLVICCIFLFALYMIKSVTAASGVFCMFADYI